MAGVFTIAVRLATAADQFDPANGPVVTFNEYTNLNAAPPSTTARLIGYAYNSGATPTPTIVVTLRRPGGANADEFILLENRTGTSGNIASFTTICGPDGQVVPRQFGIFGTAIPPVGPVMTGETYQLFVSTTGKNSAATFTAWYSVDGD